MITGVIGASAAAGQQMNKADRSSKVVNAPKLSTDRQELAVGEKVRLNGERFAPNESVAVTVFAETGYRDERFIVDNFVAFADENGLLTFGWKLPAAGRFVITARGSHSNAELSRTVTAFDNESGNKIEIITDDKNENLTCRDLNRNPSQYPGIHSDWGFKLDFENPNGTFPFVNSSNPVTELSGGAPSDPGNSVTATTTNGGRKLAWSSTRPITAVIVKGGYYGSKVYVYNPESYGDEGPMTTPTGQQISHVTFCYQPTAKIKIIKHASPPSNFQFEFSAQGLPSGNFAMTDNELNSDPMVMFETSATGLKTITETNPAPYSLVAINCSIEGSGGSTFNVAIPQVEIDLRAGDVVTCTFVNDFVTAAEASVSGRVTDPNGRPVSGAIVAATDPSGATRIARTNSLGYYRISELEAGEAYIFDVSHKAYLFGSHILSLNDESNTLNFRAIAR